MSFFAELKRRNVIRVGVAYVVAGWLLAQVVELVADAYGAPDWVLALVVTVIAIGLVPVMMFSWAYELTPEGIRRESEVVRSESITDRTGRKLNLVVVVLVLLALGVFVAERAVYYGSEPPAASLDPGEATQGATGAPKAGAESAASRDASVAVLPFTTRSMDEADRFFSDGVHDDLLTQLAKIGELKVISRTSVMEYRDTTKRLPDIASELGVATVVEGAVQRSGNMVRITAQLIDARTDEHLWAESYDRELTAQNLFTIQTEIATSIAGALQATLTPAEQAALERQLSENQDALEAYQRAGWYAETAQGDRLDRAERELAYALEHDPGFAAALARLAYVRMARYWWHDPSDEVRRSAWEALQKGRALDPDLPELDMAEGYYHYWGFLDYSRALAVLTPALAAYPNDADLHAVVGFVHRRAGDFEEALAHLEQAAGLDPRNARRVHEIAETYERLGNYERAGFFLGKLRALDPGGGFHARLAARLAASRDGDPAAAARLLEPFAGDLFVAIQRIDYLESAGDYDAALDEIARAGDREAVFGPLAWTPEIARGRVLWFSGDREAARPYLREGLARLEAMAAASARPDATLVSRCNATGALGDAEATRAVCERALDTAPPDAFSLSFWRLMAAAGYAMAGLSDEAFGLLAAAQESATAPARHTLLNDPGLRPLHDDPRWERLVAEARP